MLIIIISNDSENNVWNDRLFILHWITSLCSALFKHTRTAPWHHSPTQTQYTYTTGMLQLSSRYATAFIQPAINNYFLVFSLLFMWPIFLDFIPVRPDSGVVTAPLNFGPELCSCQKNLLEQASAGSKFSPSISENLAGLSRTKLLYLDVYWNTISLCRQMHCMTKFHDFFYRRNIRILKSFVLFNTNFAVRNLQLSCRKIATSYPQLFQLMTPLRPHNPKL